ncbi:ATP synthase subunit I [Bacillus gobiensis]|uniref:ATP synthase subunit I n=1 Tax=Bacillus gobiensis TaxID=1441095 RepID=UPI003D1A18BE
MSDPSLMLRRQLKYLFFILAVCFLGAGFTMFKTEFQGLILGTVFSMMNLWLLVRRMKAFGQAAENGKAFRSVGSAARIANAVIAVAIAYRFSDQFNMVAVIVGLMMIYPVILIDSFIQLKRSSEKVR